MAVLGRPIWRELLMFIKTMAAPWAKHIPVIAELLSRMQTICKLTMIAFQLRIYRANKSLVKLLIWWWITLKADTPGANSSPWTPLWGKTLGSQILTIDVRVNLQANITTVLRISRPKVIQEVKSAWIGAQMSSSQNPRGLKVRKIIWIGWASLRLLSKIEREDCKGWQLIRARTTLMGRRHPCRYRLAHS